MASTPIIPTRLREMEDGKTNYPNELITKNGQVYLINKDTGEAKAVGGSPYSSNIAVSSDGWSGSSAPYTKTVTVTGMTEDDNPIIGVVLSSAYETAQTELQEYSKIYKITTASDSITIYASEPLESTITLQILMNVYSTSNLEAIYPLAEEAVFGNV